MHIEMTFIFAHSKGHNPRVEGVYFVRFSCSMLYVFIFFCYKISYKILPHIVSLVLIILLEYCWHFFFRENIASDCFHGCFVVTCTLCAFISLVWLREQILHGGGPEWLEQDDQGPNHQRVNWLYFIKMKECVVAHFIKFRLICV